VDRGQGLLTGLARVVLGLLAALAAFAAIVALVAGLLLVAAEAALGALILGVAAAYEHGRYRARVQGAERGRFQRTDEVFTDPTTGRLTRVWYDPASGARDYRPDA